MGAGLTLVLVWGAKDRGATSVSPELCEGAASWREAEENPSMVQAAFLLTPKSHFKVWIRRFDPLANISYVILQ